MSATVDPNDRLAYYEIGERYEREFVELMDGDSRRIRPNPLKRNDKTAPDLIDFEGMADLKTQTVPLFTASKYGFDPFWTVTLNVKDVEHYRQRYPELKIYFWVRRDDCVGYGQKVGSLSTVRETSTDLITTWADAGYLQVHTYRKRAEGNAPDSYVLDLRWMAEVRP